jgi:hypothetical protein
MSTRQRQRHLAAHTYVSTVHPSDATQQELTASACPRDGRCSPRSRWPAAHWCGRRDRSDTPTLPWCARAASSAAPHCWDPTDEPFCTAMRYECPDPIDEAQPHSTCSTVPYRSHDAVASMVRSGAKSHDNTHPKCSCSVLTRVAVVTSHRHVRLSAPPAHI